MSTRQRSRRSKQLQTATNFLPPVRNPKARRRQLIETDAMNDTYEFLEEYDASGHHLRLERLPR